MRPMDVKELSTTTCKKYFKNKNQGRRKNVSRRPAVFSPYFHSHFPLFLYANSNYLCTENKDKKK